MMPKKYQDFLVKYVSIREKIESDIDVNKNRLSICQARQDALVSCREIMNIVSMLTHEKVKEVIECLVTDSLQSVLDDSYSFRLESTIMRNKAEMTPVVDIDGHSHSLKDELGGGVVDIVSFSLRVILWAISSNKTAGVIILDEPGKFISKDRLFLFGEMIKKLSEMMGIQFIIITHEDELSVYADRSFMVVNNNGISEVVTSFLTDGDSLE